DRPAPLSVHKVREDFDRIARLTADEEPCLAPYDAFLLGRIPCSSREVLEVGCGTGAFSRALADRGHRVTAIDLSPEMIRVARDRTSPVQDVAYECQDVMRMPTEGRGYDCVVSIATLHHLPLEEAVEVMSRLVRRGGMLVVHDIRTDRSVGDWLRAPLAIAARAWWRVRVGRLRERAEVRAAWGEHGRHERYLTMAEVAAWSGAHLPGARAFRH